MDILRTLKDVGILGWIDILLMSVLIYIILAWVKRKRAVFVLTGIIICALIYLLAYQLNLYLITYVLRAFFAVILIALIIIFREELRDLFEQIAVWSIRRKRSMVPSSRNPLVETLVRTVTDLGREKIGALIVLRGKNMLARRLEGGTELNGEVSDTILKSIFDPHSPGHDGAVLIEGTRIRRFGCHLPLSKNFQELVHQGTRHAAALGLAEVTDAMVLVVSEERGTLSVAEHSRLKPVADGGKMGAILEDFYQRTAPQPLHRNWKEFFKKNYWEKVLAFAMALSMWFVLVYESNLIHRSFEVSVQYPQLNQNLTVKEITPKTISVTFSGPSNAFHFLNEKNIRLSLKLKNPKPGTRQVELKDSNLSYPKDISLVKMDPERVQVKIGSDQDSSPPRGN